jgi:hypothetical protein
MASETNELTFVRCPTCRSLVPASASRCRICNATLEAGGDKTTSSETPATGSRVRQKTVTASAEEIKSIVGGNVTPPAPSAPAPAQVASPPSAKPASGSKDPVDEAFDPLGAFLQDLDADEPPPSAKRAESPAPSAKSSQNQADEDLISDLFGDDDDDEDDDEILLGASGTDDDEDDDDDDFDIFDDPSFEELGTATAKPAARRAETPPAPPQPKTPPAERPVAARPPEPPQRQPATPRQAPPARQEAPPRQEPPRRPEPNKPLPGARDAQKPNRPEQRAQQERPQHEVRAPQEQRKPQTPPPARAAAPMGMRPKMGGGPARPEGKLARPSEVNVPHDTAHEVDDFEVASKAVPPQPEREASRRPVESRDVRAPNPAPLRTPQPAREASQRPPEQVREQRVEQRAEQRAVAAPPRGEYQQEEVAERPSASGPRLHKMKPGRLFGWLVSFESPDGRAIELRSGRFFVTGTSIRGSDLILEDQSISTPHALMSITEKGFLLQDLMSERGTFVRSKGEAQYRREEGIIDVQHGDWIRFGDVEFLVTIVPG